MSWRLSQLPQATFYSWTSGPSSPGRPLPGNLLIPVGWGVSSGPEKAANRGRDGLQQMTHRSLSAQARNHIYPIIPNTSHPLGASPRCPTLKESRLYKGVTPHWATSTGCSWQTRAGTGNPSQTGSDAETGTDAMYVLT